MEDSLLDKMADFAYNNGPEWLQKKFESREMDRMADEQHGLHEKLVTSGYYDENKTTDQRREIAGMVQSDSSQADRSLRDKAKSWVNEKIDAVQDFTFTVMYNIRQNAGERTVADDLLTRRERIEQSVYEHAPAPVRDWMDKRDMGRMADAEYALNRAMARLETVVAQGSKEPMAESVKAATMKEPTLESVIANMPTTWTIPDWASASLGREESARDLDREIRQTSLWDQTAEVGRQTRQEAPQQESPQEKELQKRQLSM